MKFVNKIVDATYQVRPGQLDTDIRIPALKWRSKLSRITPRIARHLVATGNPIITPKIPQP